MKSFGIRTKYRHGPTPNRPGRFQGSLGIYDIKSKERFLKYIGFMLCPEKQSKLVKLLQDEIDNRKRNPSYCDFSKIKSIQKIGEEDVYDLALPQSHNFIANGLVVHNCNLASVCLPQFLKPAPYQQKYQKPHTILVYTKPQCHWCDLIKIFLEQQQFDCDVQYINADTKEQQEWYKKEMRIVTYPRVFIDTLDNTELIEVGGFEDTVRLLRPVLDYEKLEEVVGTLVENLNVIIDKNYYPVPETKRSNFKHRPIGIGVQGLSDLFAKMWIAYESDEATKVNKELFEALYYFAMKKSVALAKEQEPYSSFEGSPLSNGLFQFDLWNVEPSQQWDWTTLRQEAIRYGARNSLLMALMPTASTSQIMGNNESFEPFNSCMFLRRTLSGEFIVINSFLMRHLHSLGLWNEEMKQRIMFHRGSIQKIQKIPQYLKQMYKTVWEIKKKHLINMAADRSAFVCQSSSFNLYFEDCTPAMLTKVHLYGWKKGLKTGSYYIRSRPAAVAQSFTIDPSLEEKFKEELEQKRVEECEACSA